ncbi:MAG: replication-associated recombination protein A [Lentisphaeria bacterium]|nr:replication-associated recombination protein A [Lentisphaeria bacterium]
MSGFDDLNNSLGLGSADLPKMRPLAARVRPRSLAEYVGQQHILGPGKLLRRAIEADRFSSIILSGPPGTGKTSLAELIAIHTHCNFVRLSGVTSNVADLRREIAAATASLRDFGKRTILFVDELHRFNKAQQDVLLPDVENGNIRLIGATTHNPQFYIVGALVSRSILFQLESLGVEDITTLLNNAVKHPEAFPNRQVVLTPEAARFWASACEGDARKALNALELAVLTTPDNDDNQVVITADIAAESIQRKYINYGDDGHYDTASAFIKSMRGSSPDGAIYWLAKMLESGEDIRFIARRIVIFASEDVGNADPRALSVAVSAMQAVDFVGLPEARIILAQAVTYCATAPKSNAAYLAVDAAIKDVRDGRVQAVPVHLRDPNSSGGRQNGNGANYQYPHDFGGFVIQDYMSNPKRYYEPKNIGYESKILERMEYWRNLAEYNKEKNDK